MFHRSLPRCKASLKQESLEYVLSLPAHSQVGRGRWHFPPHLSTKGRKEHGVRSGIRPGIPRKQSGGQSGTRQEQYTSVDSLPCAKIKFGGEPRFGKAPATPFGWQLRIATDSGGQGHRPSSRAYSRRPNLHRCSGAVGPPVVGNERKSGRVLLGSFRPVAEV